MKILLAVVIAILIVNHTPAPQFNNSTIVEAKAEPVQVAAIETAARVQSQTLTEQKTIVEPEYKTNTPKAIAYEKAKQRGWTGTEWNALVTLWHNESGWNPKAYNSSSGACGIPQALPCSKIPNQSVDGQIDWGMNYIASRYGTPTKALSHWNAKVPINGRNMGHWY